MRNAKKRPLLKYKQAAKYCGMEANRFYYATLCGLGPTKAIGKRARHLFTREDLDEWMLSGGHHITCQRVDRAYARWIRVRDQLAKEPASIATTTEVLIADRCETIFSDGSVIRHVPEHLLDEPHPADGQAVV